MPRPKKDGRYLNLYLDRTLYEEFLRDEESTEREISFMGSLFFYRSNFLILDTKL